MTRARLQRRGAVLRRRLVALLVVAVALLAGYWFWLRDSSLFSVDDVSVEGVSANRERISALLESEARTMTTLHVDEPALEDAVAGFPTIAGVSADSSFPDGLEITVEERLPVAIARLGGRKVPVSGDGYLLEGVETRGERLPDLVSAGRPKGERLSPEDAEQALVLGGAGKLLAEVEESTYDPDRGGVVVQFRDGPELRFGDASRVEAKWAAAAAVIADPKSGVPGYVDVSVPERPVAG